MILEDIYTPSISSFTNKAKKQNKKNPPNNNETILLKTVDIFAPPVQKVYYFNKEIDREKTQPEQKQTPSSSSQIVFTMISGTVSFFFGQKSHITGLLVDMVDVVSAIAFF